MILAAGMRAPVASCTVPRSEPREFWADSALASNSADAAAIIALWSKILLAFLVLWVAEFSITVAGT
jgi:hypothetical protein